MIEKTGIPTAEDIKTKLPDDERLEKGPFAVIECFSSIPCDPCYHSCPVNAIAEFKDINDIPVLDFDKCTGCGMCISQCPGQAIFVVDYTFSKEKGIVKIPYEFLPVPKKGQEVIALNRAGEEVGTATIEKVQSLKAFDKTAVVWLSVKKELLMEVRNFRMGVE
jgi:Fe-S-cluster-containing hydrogenase component 2